MGLSGLFFRRQSGANRVTELDDQRCCVVCRNLHILLPRMAPISHWLTIYWRSFIRVRVTVARYASLVAVSVEHVTCWKGVLRFCRNHTSHISLSCAVAFIFCECCEVSAQSVWNWTNRSMDLRRSSIWAMTWLPSQLATVGRCWLGHRYHWKTQPTVMPEAL